MHMKSGKFVPVIQPGAAQGLVVDAKSQRADQVQRTVVCRAEPGDISRVGWNLRLAQNQVEGCFQRNLILEKIYIYIVC